jgi:acetyl esterase
MPLDPEIRQLLDDLAPVMGELDEQTPAEARALADEGMAACSGPGDQSVTAADRRVPGPAGEIPLRVYTPPGADGPRPVVVYLHGGGFVIGSIRSHDGLCRDLTAATGAVLVSVEYRLAPEHRFPAAVEDCWAALQWVHAHAAELGGDPARLAIAGDSAGGTLAGVTAMLARDHGGPALRCQLLVYPGIGVTEDQAAVRDNGEGYLLTERDIRWFMDHYLGPDGDDQDPRFDPIHAADLSGVAPAHIITCEYDPLRDGGLAYAARLRADGVTVTERCYEGLIHGAFGMEAVASASRQMIQDAAEILRAALATREAAPTGA